MDAVINIRRAGPTDKSEILDIGRTLFTHLEFIGLELELSDFFRNYSSRSQLSYTPEEVISDSRLLIAQDWYVGVCNERQIVRGFTGIEVHHFEGEHTLGWINWTGLHSDFHGNGYGKQLLDYNIERAIEHGLTSLAVKTNPEFEKACKMYESRGFTLAGTLQSSTPQGHDILIYQKLL